MKKICVFTGTRAEYHLLSPLMKRICQDPELQLDLIVTGAHLSEQYGSTYRAILADGFEINKKIYILDDQAEKTDMNQAVAKCLSECGKYFEESKPDLLVLLGDRYEILGPAIAALNCKIPIAHIHGGETTEGAIDEAIRHMVTKCSYLHFTSCEPYRQRVIQLGEEPDRVFNVGSLGVENILTQKLLTRDELAETLPITQNSRYCLSTFHPVTLENNTAEQQVAQMLEAFLQFPELKFIITKANADEGGRQINAVIDCYVEKYPERLYTEFSLGMIRYLSAMKYAELVIGNSSSGILEAPSFGVPTINIGDRQKGRIQARSVINCIPGQAEIASAMKQGLDETFRASIAHMETPYGNGTASQQMISIIKKHLNSGIDLKKKFYDLNGGTV